MATWSKKTYKMVAKVLNPGGSSFRDPQTIELIMWEFASLFQEDNPRFDRDRFYKAVFGENNN